MSLMQLLTVGHSFMDVKDEPSPYRLNRRGLLPKFDPAPAARNPAVRIRGEEVEEQAARTENFVEEDRILMTPETPSMASAASEATVPASSAFVVQAEPAVALPQETPQVDVMRPRVKLRENPGEAVPGAVVLKRSEGKVLKKLGLGRLYWPAWMFSSAVVEPNRRRGMRKMSPKAVHVVRNSLRLSDVEIVATSPKGQGRWQAIPGRALNWLTGHWRRRGAQRRL